MVKKINKNVTIKSWKKTEFQSHFPEKKRSVYFTVKERFVCYNCNLILYCTILGGLLKRPFLIYNLTAEANSVQITKIRLHTFPNLTNSNNPDY